MTQSSLSLSLSPHYFNQTKLIFFGVELGAGVGGPVSAMLCQSL